MSVYKLQYLSVEPSIFPGEVIRVWRDEKARRRFRDLKEAQFRCPDGGRVVDCEHPFIEVKDEQAS